jgi:Major tropism determinant N-terminal domain
MATRMQQRRGTAAQWTSANPVLAAGEIGFETDTNKFKIGDGTTNWASLKYFMNLDELDIDVDGFVKDEEKGAANGVATLDSSAQVPVTQLANLIQNAPNTLDTLNEIASAITDANGIVNTAIETAIDAEVIARNTAITTANGAISTRIDGVDTRIDGIDTRIDGVDATILALTTDAVPETVNNEYFTIEKAQDAAASMISGDAGVVATYDDTANSLVISVDATIATTTGVSTAISDHNSDTTNVHGIADTSVLATATDVADAVSTHNLDTTGVHGIADTAELETQTGAQAKADNALAAAVADAAATYALKVAPTITGTATVENITVTGNLVVQGTTTTVDTANLDVTDSLIYLASEQFDTDALDIGIFGAYGDANSGHFHTGLVRDASDGKWKLISAGPEPVSNVIDFSGVTYDTVKLGGVEFSDGLQTKQGVPSITPISQKTASYTLSSLSERDSLIEVGSSSATTLTIPADADVNYPVGTTLDILQTSTGQVTIAGANGVTVNATPGLKLRTQWSSATLMKRAANTWVVYGDLSA